MSSVDSPRFALWLALAVAVCTFILWCLMPTDPLVHLVEEGQLVENLTLIAYAVTILYLLLQPAVMITLRTKAAVIMALLAMMAREADLHKAIADMSMLKLRFWTGGLPGIDKLIGLLVLMPIVVACLYLLIQYAMPTIRAIKASRAYAVTIATFIGLIALTNGIDRSLGIIKEWTGWHAPEWLVALQTSQEEFLELLLPLLVVVATFQYRRYQLSRHAVNRPAGSVL